jgi:hypothetical protein
MITKTRLREQLEKLPERFSIDELIDRLVFIEKLEKRLDLSGSDQTISEAELDNEMKKWFE